MRDEAPVDRHANAPHQHKAEAPSRLRFAILTISDSRSVAEDASGDRIHHLASKAGHDVTRRELVRDEAPEIQAAVLRLTRSSDVDVVVATGGTGLAPRDVTPEAVAPLFSRRIPGFGELFRVLSLEAIGSAAMLSRADAGIVEGRPVFLLPGSPDACDLAMTRLVLPEAGHLLGLLGRPKNPLPSRGRTPPSSGGGV